MFSGVERWMQREPKRRVCAEWVEAFSLCLVKVVEYALNAGRRDATIRLCSFLNRGAFCPLCRVCSILLAMSAFAIAICGDGVCLFFMLQAAPHQFLNSFLSCRTTHSMSFQVMPPLSENRSE